jgi:hypothetical protein
MNGFTLGSSSSFTKVFNVLWVGEGCLVLTAPESGMSENIELGLELGYAVFMGPWFLDIDVRNI